MGFWYLNVCTILCMPMYFLTLAVPVYLIVLFCDYLWFFFLFFLDIIKKIQWKKKILGHLVVFSDTGLWWEETKMAVASKMTCKIGLIWRHTKTLYNVLSLETSRNVTLWIQCYHWLIHNRISWTEVLSCVINVNLGIDQFLNSTKVLPVLRVLEWGFQLGVRHFYTNLGLKCLYL